MRAAALLPEMLARVAALGCPREHTLELLGHDGGDNIVIAVELDDGRVVVAKRFASPRSFAQAHAALAWFGGRERCGGARVERALLVDAEASLMVCERLPGTHAHAPAEAVHRAAGRFLAALHARVLPDPDPLVVAEALPQRHRAWLRACAGRLTPEQRQVAEQLRPTPELFAGSRRAPCHRDFTPENWLWDGKQLAVLDFEHARLDLAVCDLAKLAVGVWSRSPALAASFFTGYGVLADADTTRLRCAVVLHGLASLAWGWRHHAERFVDEGTRALVVAEHWPPLGWDSATRPPSESSMMGSVPELDHEDDLAD